MRGTDRRTGVQGGEAGGFMRRLAASRRGNTAIIFGFSLLPIALAAGAAVDLRRQATSKGYLQDSTDAAVLAAAKGYYGAMGLSAAQRLDRASRDADAFMSQALARETKTIDQPTWSLTHDRATGEFLLSASARAPAAFGGLFGVDSLGIGASSAANSGERRLEVAMVLDSTGSMAGSKMANLKTAAVQFVSVMEGAAASHPKPDAVKLSLVPYNNAVRPGAAYADAAWLDTEGRSKLHYENLSVVTAGQPLPPAQRVQAGRTLPTRLDLFDALNVKWGGCVETRPYPHDVEAEAPTAAEPDTLYVPYFAPDEPDRTDGAGAPTAFASAYTQNDYLVDGVLPDDAKGDWFKRQQTIAKYEMPVKRTNASRGPNRECSVAPVVRLTTSYGAIRSGIAAMKAEGNTNIFNGLEWGWNAIAPQAPWNDGASADPGELSKIIILMTDGTNVHSGVPNPNNSPYAAVGYLIKNRLGLTSGTEGQRQKAMDKRLSALCESVKAKGAIIYAVRVEVNDGDDKVLKGCATSPDHFRDVRDASQLDTVFADIARSILQVRLSR